MGIMLCIETHFADVIEVNTAEKLRWAKDPPLSVLEFKTPTPNR